MTYEQWIGALCLWREARGEPLDAKRAVWHVILNRLADKRWPDDIPGVILQRKQFSSFNANDPNVSKFPAIGDTSFQECIDVVTNPLTDPTEGANHYESCSEMDKPSWTKGVLYTKIGAFRFYKL
jgi:hypothetical protein